MKINPRQLRRLQTLYNQFERHTLDVDAGRDARLAWASRMTGRTIDSFNQLSLDEAKRCIDALQGVLGVKAPNRSPRPRMSRYAAEKAGTEGRRDQIHAETTLVTETDLSRIQDQLSRLGWEQPTLERFLLSSRSPLKGRTQIRTLGDSNKVLWALKRISPRKEQLAS